MQHLGVSQILRVNTLPIQCQKIAGSTCRLIDLLDLAVAGFFHTVALIPSQKLHQKVIQKVCTGADKDIFRIYLHTAELIQMPGNGIAQSG